MKIYLAHPCFTEEQSAFKKQFTEKISAILTRDIILVDPFDYTPNGEGDREVKLNMATTIKIECIRLLEACDIIVALVDDNDTGTAFEAGYAHAINKPVILISRESCSAANAMLIGSAQVMIDHVLQSEQIGKLVRVLEDFYAAMRNTLTVETTAIVS
jgi:nucleoside 2-deoxyribosyltransferase